MHGPTNLRCGKLDSSHSYPKWGLMSEKMQEGKRVEQKASPSAKAAIKVLAGDFNFNFTANVLWYIKYALY